MRHAVGVSVAIGALAIGCQSGDEPPSASPASSVVRLRLVEARTPPLRVPRFTTSGTFPQVMGVTGLNAANRALREAIEADQRAYAPYARREKPKVHYRVPGVYRTSVDRSIVSASSVVVSALLPRTHEIFPGQSGGDGWLGVTVEVPSGRRVHLEDLFVDPSRGLRVLAHAWQQRAFRPCVRIYGSIAYTPRKEHYREFALTPRGVAVGSNEIAACYRLVATVPYSVLQPHLSKRALRLISGVRWPR